MNQAQISKKGILAKSRLHGRLNQAKRKLTEIKMTIITEGQVEALEGAVDLLDGIIQEFEDMKFLQRPEQIRFVARTEAEKINELR